MNERDVFIAALQRQNAADRSVFLQEACGSNADLRQQVEVLLREHDQLGSFLEAPAAASLTQGARGHPRIESPSGGSEMTASEAKPKFLKITLRIFAVIAGGVAVVVVIALWTVLSLYKVAKEPTALMRASRAGDIELVQRLLRQGADVNERRGYSIRVGIFLVHGPSEPLYGDSAVTAGVESGNELRTCKAHSVHCGVSDLV